jgi:hypothetical protein
MIEAAQTLNPDGGSDVPLTIFERRSSPLNPTVTPCHTPQILDRHSYQQGTSLRFPMVQGFPSARLFISRAGVDAYLSWEKRSLLAHMFTS